MRRLRGIFLSAIIVSTCAVGQVPTVQPAPWRGEQLFPAETIYSDSSCANVSAHSRQSSEEYLPLTSRQKFGYFLKSAASPYVLADGLISSVSWQMSKYPPFEKGSLGFAEGYGAAIAQREASLFMSRFLIPAALHQDPRYFPAREGSSAIHRAAFAASRVFLTRSDSGGQTWNGSYIFGNLASAGLANLYISNRDPGAIFSDFAVGMGTDAGMNILKEFWPSVRKYVPGKRVKQLGDLVIGTNHSEPTADEKPKTDHLLPRFLP